MNILRRLHAQVGNQKNLFLTNLCYFKSLNGHPLNATKIWPPSPSPHFSLMEDEVHFLLYPFSILLSPLPVKNSDHFYLFSTPCMREGEGFNYPPPKNLLHWCFSFSNHLRHLESLVLQNLSSSAPIVAYELVFLSSFQVMLLLIVGYTSRSADRGCV